MCSLTKNQDKFQPSCLLNMTELFSVIFWWKKAVPSSKCAHLKSPYLQDILDLHPHIYHVVELDITIVLAARRGHCLLKVSKDDGVRSSHSVEFVKEKLQQFQQQPANHQDNIHSFSRRHQSTSEQQAGVTGLWLQALLCDRCSVQPGKLQTLWGLKVISFSC